MKKKVVLISIFFFGFLTFFCFRQGIVKQVVSAYLGKQLQADIDIKRIEFISLNNIDIYSLQLDDMNGLALSADTGNIRFDLFDFFREGIKVRFRLDEAELYYKGSELVTSILETLSLQDIDRIDFTSIDGEFSSSREQFMLRSINCHGESITLNAYGIAGDDIIDFDITMQISKELISGIPESVRRVFFRQEQDIFRAELHITGSADNPSINFKTDLFTFTVK
jgi:hypothetical protein